jgi:outer membrane immunogenic protein
MTRFRSLPTRLTAATAACLALATALPINGYAADLDGPPPRERQAEVWTPAGRPALFHGFYYGLSAGFGFGNSTLFDDLDNSRAIASTEPSGFMGSVTAGYNWRLGYGLVYGVEADLGLMDVSAEDKLASDGSIYKTQLGPLWGTLRARLGFMLSDRMMVFATGGGAFMQADDVSVGSGATTTALTEDFQTGYIIGAGAEYALSDTMSIKAEYLYMDFGRVSGLTANGGEFSFENEIQLVRAGLNFKF